MSCARKDEGGTVAERATARDRMKDEPCAERPRTAALRSPFTLHPSSLRPRSGFTLIEILLAAALVAMVAGTLFAAVRAIVKSRDAAQQILEPTRAAEVVFEQLRADLENAQPPRETFAGAFLGQTFDDNRTRDADSILLYTTAAGPQHVSADGEIRRVEYLVTSGESPDSEHVLIRRVISNLNPSSGQQPPADDEILCRRVGRFNVTYTDGATAAATWDSTQANNTLPAAILVELELDPAGGPYNVEDPARPRPLFRRVFHIPAGTRSTDSVGLGAGGALLP